MKHVSNNLVAFLFLLCTTLLSAAGCQTQQQNAADAAATNAKAADYSAISISEALLRRDELLATEDFSEKLLNLIRLEQQAQVFYADEPLRLGSIGATILEINPMSLTGHWALERFYRNVDATETANYHGTALQQLRAHLTQTGNGSRSQPYLLLTMTDAATHLRLNELERVGGIYQLTDKTPLGLVLIGRDTNDTLQRTNFDLSSVMAPALRELRQQNTGISETNPWPILRALAAEQDDAAQTAIGTYLAKQQSYDAAVGWLQAATRQGNIVANLLLARIFWYLGDQAQNNELVPEDETEIGGHTPKLSRSEYRSRAEGEYLQAIDLGSSDAMYTLGRLYLEGSFGTATPAQAVTLLERAGSGGRAEAYLFLGQQRKTGQHLPQDLNQAELYFAKAAELDNAGAVITYARFLVNENTLPQSGQVIAWLNDLVKANDAEAMVVMGHLHARGIGVDTSKRRAVNWYKKAVKQAFSDADDAAEIVNEVAWILAVTSDRSLMRRRYAHSIMTTLMAQEGSANKRPEYLDTWAATYAATGNFAEAVKVQQRAIDVAREQQRADIVVLLEKHLEIFQNGGTIEEPVF
ncbi:MAG TPA: hypothetical protein DER02_03460 [Gammaproteobacteria bacterium]|nr:hypothetical protein [Gammaproteobacteria bacterium]